MNTTHKQAHHQIVIVGGGAYELAKTKRPEVKCIPKGAKWIKTAVAEFVPERNAVTLNDGKQINYDYLVVCPGIQLDWRKIEGLEATLGRNGVCSNYLPHLAEYTWQCLPQSAPDFVKQSPLADSAGWVDIDAESMQHKRYPNVFSLGMPVLRQIRKPRRRCVSRRPSWWEIFWLT